MAEASNITWKKVLDIYHWKSRREILKVRSYSADSDAIKSLLLDYKVLPSCKEIQEDHLNYFHNIIKKHARNNAMLRHILNNLKDVKPK